MHVTSSVISHITAMLICHVAYACNKYPNSRDSAHSSLIALAYQSSGFSHVFLYEQSQDLAVVQAQRHVEQELVAAATQQIFMYIPCDR